MSIDNTRNREKTPVAYRVEPIDARGVHYAIEQYFMSPGISEGEVAEAVKVADDMVNFIMKSISSDKLALFTPQTYSPAQAALEYTAATGNAITTLFNTLASLIDKSCSGDDNVKCSETVSKIPILMRTMPLIASRVSTFMLARLSISSIIPANKAAEAVFYARWVAAMPSTQETPQPQPQAQQQQQQQQREENK